MFVNLRDFSIWGSKQKHMANLQYSNIFISDIIDVWSKCVLWLPKYMGVFYVNGNKWKT